MTKEEFFEKWKWINTAFCDSDFQSEYRDTFELLYDMWPMLPCPIFWFKKEGESNMPYDALIFMWPKLTLTAGGNIDPCGSDIEVVYSLKGDSFRLEGVWGAPDDFFNNWVVEAIFDKLCNMS